MNADEFNPMLREPSPEEVAAQEAMELPDREVLTLLTTGGSYLSAYPGATDGSLTGATPADSAAGTAQSAAGTANQAPSLLNAYADPSHTVSGAPEVTAVDRS